MDFDKPLSNFAYNKPYTIAVGNIENKEKFEEQQDVEYTKIKIKNIREDYRGSNLYLPNGTKVEKEFFEKAKSILKELGCDNISVHEVEDEKYPIILSCGQSMVIVAPKTEKDEE